jgi:hypothetical protein
METDTINGVLNYRLLRPEEWERARSIFAEFGHTLPPKETSLLSIAEDESSIKGLLCFQPIMHCEPIWVDENSRGHVNVLKLHRSLMEVLPKGLEYYAFTPSRKISWIAGMGGMKPLPWGVWKGIV